MTPMLAVRTAAPLAAPTAEPWLYGSQKYATRHLTTDGMVGCHAVYACTPDGTVIGRLLWDLDTGEVWWIGVTAEFRRRGIATALWHLAHHKAATAQWAVPQHSDTRLPDGEAWIASL